MRAGGQLGRERITDPEHDQQLRRRHAGYPGDHAAAVRAFEKAGAICEVPRGVQPTKRKTDAAREMLRQGRRLCLLLNDPLNGAQYLTLPGWPAESEQNPRCAVTLMATAAIIRTQAAQMFVFLLPGDLHDACEVGCESTPAPTMTRRPFTECTQLSFDQAVSLALAEEGNRPSMDPKSIENLLWPLSDDVVAGTPANARRKPRELRGSREEAMSHFDIDVTREGGWWTVHVPAVGGVTQARFPREVEQVARQYIAVTTETPIDRIVVNWRRCPL